MSLGPLRSVSTFAFAALGAAWILAAPRCATASSDFDTGGLESRTPGAGLLRGPGVCRLYLGPREFLEDGEFLLRFTQVGDSFDDALELLGTAIPDGAGGYDLSADDEAAEDFYEQVLRSQLALPFLGFDLTRLELDIFEPPFEVGRYEIACELRLAGTLSGTYTAPRFIPLSPARRIGTIRIGPPTRGEAELVYTGPGVAIPGIGADVDSDPAEVADRESLAAAATSDASDATVASAAAEAGNCPRPDYAPAPSHCGTPDCLVDFAGYKWWTEYQYWPDSGYFYNMNNAWSPKNVTVDGEGLHLFVRVQDVGGGPRYTAAEAVAVLNPDGSLAEFGFGTYLVTARIKTAASWDAMDPNVAFGAFTYERDPTGTTFNPARELDLTETSRWGRVDGQPCKNIPQLCTGNSQFTVQEWNRRTDNLHRYTIDPSAQTITLVMEWNAANQPVTFRQFDGDFSLADLPANANNVWTTSADQNPFIPDSGCQQFHLNLWMGNYALANQGYNPPPASPQEVVVTRFEFQPRS